MSLYKKLQNCMRKMLGRLFLLEAAQLYMILVLSFAFYIITGVFHLLYTKFMHEIRIKRTHKKILAVFNYKFMKIKT